MPPGWRIARDSGGHDDPVRRRRVVDNRLVTGETPTVAVLRCRGGDMGEIVAHTRLPMPERKRHAALCDRAKDFSLLSFGPCEGDSLRPQDQGRDHGLNHQHFAHLLKERRHVDGRAAEPAVLFGGRQCQPPHLREGGPGLAAPPFLQRQGLGAGFEGVLGLRYFSALSARSC